MNTPPVTPRVLDLLFRAAASRFPRRGRAAILARLEDMGRDLFPGGGGLFASLFAVREDDGKRGGGSGIPSVWDIGEAFWRDAYPGLETRRREGSFYTPPEVIDRVLDMVWEQVAGGGQTVCDPALGCGFFFIRLLERLLAERPERRRAIRAWAAERLYGVEIEPAALFMARALLWLALSGPDGEFIPDPAHFREGDSLLGPAFPASPNTGGGLDWAAAFPDIAANGGFDVIVGNPPYEVLTNFAARPGHAGLADAIRRSGLYRDALKGQVNLYRCFIERSLDLLRPGGRLALVVPLSLARDAAALPIRRRLLREHAATDWVLFGENDRLFPGVTQSACIFRAEKGGGEAAAVRIASASGGGDMKLADLDSLTGGALVLPILTPEEREILLWLADNCRGRFGDVVEARVGEVDQTVFRECMRDDDTGCLLARGAHLSAFHLDARPLPGKDRFLDLPRFLAMKRRTAAACRERAGEVRVAQLGIRNMQSIPRLAAALLPPGIYAGNSLNVYRSAPGFDPAFIAGMLNSSIMDWLFRLGSGNNNINLHEMLRLPFPSDPDPAAMAEVAERFRDGERTAAAGGDLTGCRNAVNRAAAACYGLPERLAAFFG